MVFWFTIIFKIAVRVTALHIADASLVVVPSVDGVLGLVFLRLAGLVVEVLVGWSGWFGRERAHVPALKFLIIVYGQAKFTHEILIVARSVVSSCIFRKCPTHIFTLGFFKFFHVKVFIAVPLILLCSSELIKGRIISNFIVPIEETKAVHTCTPVSKLCPCVIRKLTCCNLILLLLNSRTVRA